DARGWLRAVPALSVQGLPVEEDRDAFVEEAAAAAAKAAAQGGDEARMSEAIRQAVRRVARDWTGKRPVTDVTILRV
ncbi:MAG: MBL fold metallo-hydrolase, partial [Sphingomonadaceae bacterium]